MEFDKSDGDIKEKCSTNGNCTPSEKKNSLELNHSKNIDDISTPSELKFDLGTINYNLLIYTVNNKCAIIN